MELGIEKIALLLLVSAVVAMVARRLRLPYSIGLVIAGLALSRISPFPPVQFSRDLLFTVLLPPLIFEAALYIHWQELRKDLAVILVLATIGVVLSAGVTALGMRYLVKWEWPSAVLFSILIAATDPVSVIATFKEIGVRGRLRFLIEAESLFNDGTAAVAFAVAGAFVAGQSLTAAGLVTSLLLTVGGGFVCGAAAAALALLLAGRTNDHLVETTLTTAAAYGSFLLAEHFHFSGVLATLTAGVILGNVGALGTLSEKGKDAINSFWEYAAFLANSFVFLLIGMNASRGNISPIWATVLAAIVLVLVGRAAAVYLTLWPFARSAARVSFAYQHVLVWGGLRGALALALALGLPDTIPRREEILTVTFGVVAFSIFVQGLTVPRMLRHLGEMQAE